MVTYSIDQMIPMNMVTVFIQETCTRILEISFLFQIWDMSEIIHYMPHMQVLHPTC